MSSIWKLLYIIAMVIVGAYIAVFVPVVLINIDAYNYAESIETIDVVNTSIIVNGMEYVRAEALKKIVYTAGCVFMLYGILFLILKILSSFEMLWKMRQGRLDYPIMSVAYSVAFVVSIMCSLLCIGEGDVVRYGSYQISSLKMYGTVVNILVSILLIEAPIALLLYSREVIENVWKRKRSKLL